MYVAQQTIQAAKRNGEDNIHGQFTGGTANRIRAHRVVDLLAIATSPGAQHDARLLLCKMSERRWAVMAPRHSNDNDPTPHINVLVQNVQYHLRLDSRGCIFDITGQKDGQTFRLSGREPYQRPGA